MEESPKCWAAWTVFSGHGRLWGRTFQWCDTRHRLRGGAQRRDTIRGLLRLQGDMPEAQGVIAEPRKGGDVWTRWVFSGGVGPG